MVRFWTIIERTIWMKRGILIKLYGERLVQQNYVVYDTKVIQCLKDLLQDW